jgi:eukaryotic-like serine/threonine-protein kinase
LATYTNCNIVPANAALDDLRASAPAFAAQAQSLAVMERFDEAVEKLDYAIKLRPDVPDFLLAKADLLECQLRFGEAGPIYRAALRLNPQDTRAQTNAALCEKLLSEQATQPKLSRDRLVEFLAAMKQEHRSAAQMQPVGRLLGKESQLLLATWLERLKDLPIPSGRPLAQRLTLDEEGLLKLDLSDTPVADLSLLRGAPVSELDLDNTRVADLAPLAELPLKKLLVRGTPVNDLAVFGTARCKSTLQELWLWRTKVTDISPLAQCGALTLLDLAETGVTSLEALRTLKAAGSGCDSHTGARPLDSRRHAAGIPLSGRLAGNQRRVTAAVPDPRKNRPPRRRGECLPASRVAQAGKDFISAERL